MGFFQELTSEAQARKLEFLVIGGLAVIFHGHSRETIDLDLLVSRQQRANWTEVLVKMGYAVQRDAEVFLQFVPPPGAIWPVDLMLVAQPTFDEMFAAGLDALMYGVTVRIPSLEHLLSLKLHALKHGHIGRHAKDLLDVEALVRANHLDVGSKKMRDLFLKYGTLKIYEQISRFSADQR